MRSIKHEKGDLGTGGTRWKGGYSFFPKRRIVEHTSFVHTHTHTLIKTWRSYALRRWRPITCLDNNNNRNGISADSLLWEFHTLRFEVFLFLFCWCCWATMIAVLRWFYLPRRKWLWSERDENFSIRIHAGHAIVFLVVGLVSKQVFFRFCPESKPVTGIGSFWRGGLLTLGVGIFSSKLWEILKYFLHVK